MPDDEETGKLLKRGNDIFDDYCRFLELNTIIENKRGEIKANGGRYSPFGVQEEIEQRKIFERLQVLSFGDGLALYCIAKSKIPNTDENRYTPEEVLQALREKLSETPFRALEGIIRDALK